MNDLLKSLSKALHPFGYHVRPRNGLNLLRVPALERENKDLAATRNAIGRVSPPPHHADLDILHVYLRTCLRAGRNINTRARLGGDMMESARRCIWSLVRSVNHARLHRPGLTIRLTVMDDRSSPECLDEIRNIVALCDVETEIRTTLEAGQGASLHETFGEGAKDNALVYFVEDDYLHEEDAILTMCQFYKAMAQTSGTNLVLYPQEHGELYSNLYPSYIVQGEDRHWRTMRHATHTFLTHGAVVKEHWQNFENTKFVGNKKKRKKGSENRTTNKLFQKIPGFSPLRPCAVHFQFEELLPPFFAWQALWDQNSITFSGKAAKKDGRTQA